MFTRKYPIVALSFFLLINLSACATAQQQGVEQGSAAGRQRGNQTTALQQATMQQVGNQTTSRRSNLDRRYSGDAPGERGAITPLKRAGNYQVQIDRYPGGRQQPYQGQAGQYQGSQQSNPGQSGQYQGSQQPNPGQSGQYQGSQQSNPGQSGQYQGSQQSNPGQSGQYQGGQQPQAGQIYETEVLRAQAAQAIKVMVTATLPVKRQLPDDLKGLKHEKFLLSLSNGSTILVAHNIDQANYVPIKPGDLVTIHGEYIWNARGGLIHWTHRSDTPRHESGWIELNGQRYE